MTLVPATTIVTSLVVSGVAAWGMFHLIAEMKLLGGKRHEDMLSWSGAHRASVERKFMGAVSPLLLLAQLHGPGSTADSSCRPYTRLCVLP